MQKKMIFGIVLILVVAFFSIVYLFNNKDFYKKAGSIDDNIKTNDGSYRKKELISLIESKISQGDGFDKNNLKYFEITDLYQIGYFASTPNIVYIQVNYKFECNDNTFACNRFDYFIDDEPDQTFTIVINTKDSEYIEIMQGISVNISSIGYLS